MSTILHVSPGDLGVLAIGLVIAGAVGGLSAGVLGVGGGIVVVPVLYHVMATLGIDANVRMHIAIATSLAAILPASLARMQEAKDRIDWTLVRRWTVPMLGGAVAGCLLFGLVDGLVLVIAFAALALAIVLCLALDFGKRPIGQWPPGIFGGLVASAFVGASSVMTGIGGNTIAFPVTTLYGMPQPRIAGTTSVFAALIAIPAVFGAVLTARNMEALPPYSLGYVSLPAFALLAPMLLFTEPAGAALAHMIDLKRLRFVFAALIVIVTARMLWDALV